VFRPDGAIAATDDTVDKPGFRCVLPIRVKPGEAAAIWSVSLTQVGTFLLEDMQFSLEGDVLPFVADDPARLAIPILWLEKATDDGKTSVAVRCEAPAGLLGKATLHLRVNRVGEKKPVLDRIYRTPENDDMRVVFPAAGFVHFRLDARLEDAGGELISHLRQSLATAYGSWFKEVEHVEAHTPAPVSAADRQRGYQVFRRGEPGEIRPTSFPAAGEVVERVEAQATPGEFETVFFAFYPLRNGKKARLRLAEPVSPEGRRLPLAAIDVRMVRCWPQRTNWRSSTFHVIPELLEPGDTFSPRQGIPQQVALAVRVPADAAPGVYTAPLQLELDGTGSRAVDFVFRVLPYRLLPPPGITWGLYPDSGRWKGWPEARIRAELENFANHGITALMTYPLRFVDFTYAGGKVHADFRVFQRQIDLAREVGLGGPMVVSIQSSESFIRKLIGAADTRETPEYLAAYRQMLALIGAQAKKGKWPEFCLHSVDEPNSGDKAKRAVRTLTLIKQAGFKTFNTCYGDFVRTHLDPVLDYRCYNNIGYLSMETPEKTAALRRETLAAGDVFWWYGTGCYTNRGLIQDGNMISNRFMGGIHFLRTRATGAWAWTFLRVNGSPESDFDGPPGHRLKDACIAYPTPDGHGLVATIQWEAIREGVDDYKYIYTLYETLKQAAASRNPATRLEAEKIRADLETAIDRLPWTTMGGKVTNGDLDLLRGRIADWTIRLRGQLK
jgi:hypothetical protein